MVCDIGRDGTQQTSCSLHVLVPDHDERRTHTLGFLDDRVGGLPADDCRGVLDAAQTVSASDPAGRASSCNASLTC